MPGSDDITRLRQHAEGDEAAFNELVERHINLVYSTALRQTGNPSQAEEITQSVFILLAQKANAIRSGVILSGWLYQATRLTAANFLRAEIRRQKHEQEAYMESLLHESTADAWHQIAPWLDEAMGQLSEKDRNLIVLRYFENKSAAEIGAVLRIDAPTAQKRLTRAVDSLRKCFLKRSVVHAAEVLTGTISTCAVQSAPAGLAKSVSLAVLAKGAAASGSTLPLIKSINGALKIMAWTKIKTVVVAAAVALCVTGTTVVCLEKAGAPRMDEAFWQMKINNENDWNKLPPVLIIRPARYATPAMRSESSLSTLSDDGKTFRKVIARNIPIISMLSMAYPISKYRMILPVNIPTNHFDLMVTVPVQPQAALQKAIEQKFGLVGRREVRETDALLLKVKDPVLFSAHISKPGTKRGYKDGQRMWGWTGFPMDVIADYLEGTFQKPVLMAPGFSKTYDLIFHWNDRQDEAKAITEELAQAGLELVPSREPIEMLVVEKSK